MVCRRQTNLWKMAAVPVMTHAGAELSLELVLDLLRSKQSEAVSRLHKPKGGEVFVVPEGPNSK